MEERQLYEAYETLKPWLPALAAGVAVLWLVKSGVLKRITDAVIDIFFSHWQLALLGTAAITLSAASGWTTWDGMTNFTGEPWLSAMITFGIQGVLLIISWLIGESFATGMSYRGKSIKSAAARRSQAILGGVAGTAVAAGLFLLLWPAIDGSAAPAETSALTGTSAAIVLSALGLIALMAIFSSSDVVSPYLQGGRIIIKNAMLWVMLFACMGTAVFFSFDSRFNAVFPAGERVRAAEFRAQSQVGGLIADIDQAIGKRTATEADNLFGSDGWQAYDTQIKGIAKIAADSSGAIERYMNKQIEDRARAINEQQERMSSAQSGQAGLAQKKISLTEEKARLVTDRPSLAAEYAQKKSELDAKSKEVDAKRVEALAEGKGVEGTGKEGRGPVYRQRMAELSKLQDTFKIAEERTKDSQKRLQIVESRLAEIDRELATIDGDLAKLKGEADTAEQRIKLANQTIDGDVGPKLDPARLVPAFERSQAEFREKPSSEQLGKVQSYCGEIYSALSGAPETKERLGALDCDPKAASDAAGALFAVQAGSKIFNQSCVGGDKLTANKGVDNLFTFARKCLADAGLPSGDTDVLREKINSAELNRDDKAHRFVVSLNAFKDGNRLAYLALGISIGIEALIFMSGLFGANAVRSPLSDVPSHKARTAAQLESTINAALGNSPHETALLFLSSLRPITNDDGFSSISVMDQLDPVSAARVRMVLTAGSDIGAVELRPSPYDRSRHSDAYYVRGELREYLSSVVEREAKKDGKLADRAKLTEAISEAVAPHPHENSDIVLRYMIPIKEVDGFTSTISLFEIVSPYDKSLASRVILAATPFDCARPDRKLDDRFLLRPELSSTLSRLRATAARSPHFAHEWTSEAVIRSALAPEVYRNAEAFLRRVKPIKADDGFGFEIEMSGDAEPNSEELVLRRVASAAATLGLVDPDEPQQSAPPVEQNQRGLLSRFSGLSKAAEAPSNLPVEQKNEFKQRVRLKVALYTMLLKIRASEPESGYDPRPLEHRNQPPIDAGALRAEHAGNVPDATPRTAIAGPQQKPPPVRPQLTHEEKIELQSQYYSELLGAIGLTPERTAIRLKGDGVAEAAIQAWKALFERRRGNPLLGELLRDYQREQEEALSAAYSRLRVQIGGDERKLNILDSVDNRIQQQLPIYMLFPENGLTAFLIEQLELAAQADDGELPTDTELRQMLRNVHAELSSANLANSHSWQNIGRMLAG